MFTAYAVIVIFYRVVRQQRDKLMATAKMMFFGGLIFTPLVGPIAAECMFAGLCMMGAAYSSWLFPASAWSKDPAKAVDATVRA